MALILLGTSVRTSKSMGLAGRGQLHKMMSLDSCHDSGKA